MKNDRVISALVWTLNKKKIWWSCRIAHAPVKRFILLLEIVPKYWFENI